ncbi:MAG TPA: ABC transporter ATP-binding protein [Firmicutes bacterium]|nr:ABC transporter ATP-binding protein [Bacillota bacterium]
MEAKLQVNGVAKCFQGRAGRVEALSAASFSVTEGEFITLLGPSGCGKSTLLRIIAGLEEPSAGEVLLDGRPITGPGPERGMVFQSYTLFPWLTVRANIEFGLELKGVPRAERQQIVARYLKLIGLTGFEQALPKNLSGGMKQRVAIARALANDPEVLLMDEPFGALDAQTRMVMQEVLLTAWEESKKTILFVTHDVEEAVFLADKVFVMTARPGQIKAILDVRLPRPRPFAIKASPPFLHLKEQALALIREETLKAVQMG